MIRMRLYWKANKRVYKHGDGLAGDFRVYITDEGQ